MTSQTATKQDLKDLQRSLKKEIVDEITTVLSDAMNVIGLNFQGLESRFGKLEARFDGLQNHFEGLETRFDRLETRFDGLESRFGKLEIRFDNLEGRFGTFEGEFQNMKDTQYRMERKLDISIERLDNHEVRHKRVEKKLKLA